MGHWEQDFDTGAHLSGIDPYVTIVPFCLSVLYPLAPFAIQTQAIQDGEQAQVLVVFSYIHMDNLLEMRN